MRPSSIAILGLIALGALAGCGGASEAPEAASPANYATMSRDSGGAAGMHLESAPAEAVEISAKTTSSSDARPMAAEPSSGSGPGFAARGAKQPASTTPPSPQSPPPDRDGDGIADTQDKAPPDPSGPITKDAPHEATMLIYTAHVTMAVYQVEPGLANVEKIARELGGYLSNRGDTEITVRIPRARFDEAIRRVGLTGDVLHKELSAEDVTDAFVDLEIRVKNARNMRDRLAELLKRADVKAALEIEKELGRITGEIEAMEGKLKVLRDRIAYSTITVTFQGRGAGALRDMPLRLPFPWLSELGLPRLLSLHE
ncbi:MAG: hypothetical protein JWM74_2021 [Myxococcaceae bacterium]|nr:hypothetical protein [Myxococcaceae bacterium]